jgi:hypothetical protein
MPASIAGICGRYDAAEIAQVMSAANFSSRFNS